ncbi:MAG: hypothetical protein OXE59_08310 [Bacteroidetes bacterium]|nr:hypothetical protein [Bacteroidota bacterium]MCY4233722.1 hypothetical protein [Bacteroidota bacterium]
MHKDNTTERKRLLLKYLYREEVDTEQLYELLNDSGNLEEFETMKAVKKQLENPAQRQNVSVSEDVVNRVLLVAKQKSKRAQRTPRLAIFGSIGTVAVCALFVLLQTIQNDEEPIQDSNQTSSQVEIQWDDTQERIEMQQALNIVRQRTNPDLWDESDVIRLDSLYQPTSSLPGVQTARSTPQ